MAYLWLLPAEWEFAIQDNLIQYETLSYHYCWRNNLFEHTYRNQNPATKLSSGTFARRAGNWIHTPEEATLVQNIRNSVK